MNEITFYGNRLLNSRQKGQSIPCRVLWGFVDNVLW